MPPRYYPNPYDPYYYQSYQSMPQQAVPQQPPMQQNQPQQNQSFQQQIQNGGFVSVRNEEEARNYPVAPGTSVTFKDENAPYCYTKTKGFSQLEEPFFEKYKLVKEDTAIEATRSPAETQAVQFDNYVLKDDFQRLMDTVDAISDEIELLQKKFGRKKEDSRNADT